MNTQLKITLVAHDIRSTHNVGAFFRTCDGLGIDRIIFSGYTPYPTFEGDSRLPHFADKITRQIHKTALGAESSIKFLHFDGIEECIAFLKNESAVLIALEQAPGSLSPQLCREKILQDYKDQPISLLLGNEIHGVHEDTLKQMDMIIEIPMHGMKESLNVSVAAGIALYELSQLNT
jgi:23S rRNA (guanosine2251-2'-O)-methyltransferase